MAVLYHRFHALNVLLLCMFFFSREMHRNRDKQIRSFSLLGQQYQQRRFIFLILSYVASSGTTIATF